MRRLRVVQLDTLLGQQLRKIPAPFGSSKNSHREGRGREGKTLSLVITEEEQLVFLDRSPDRAAEHVPAHLIFGAAGWCTAPVALPAVGIEHVIAEEFKKTAMQLIGPRFDRGADNPSLEVPEFSRGVVGDYVEFLYGIDARDVSDQVV